MAIGRCQEPRLQFWPRLSDAFESLLDVTDTHRDVEPVEDMRDLLSRGANHGAFQRRIAVAENRDVSARNPTLGA